MVIAARARYLRQQEGGSPPRNPLPRKKIPADLRSLARGHTALCIKVLAGIVQNGQNDAARVAVAAALLDRGWGRPPQAHTGEDGEGAIQIIVRNITEEMVQQRPLQIEGVVNRTYE